MSVSIQKSFLTKKKSLFLIATPIGNLQEISLRAIDTLKNSDIIICESRNSCLKILNHLEIEKKNIITYDNIKEKSDFLTSKVIEKMSNFDNISMISNAGYPLISDPGRKLVREWINLGNNVTTVSGSSSVLNSIVSSGFYFHNFTFLGFLSRNVNKQKKVLREYSNLKNCLIICESPLRVIRTLRSIEEVFENRMIAICRELTKIHEEIIRGDIKSIISFIEEGKIKILGEIIIIVSIEKYLEKKTWHFAWNVKE